MAASTKNMILPSSTAQLHFLHRLAAHSRDGTRRTSFKYSQPRFIRAQSSRSDSIPCRVSILSEQPNKQANYFSPAEAQDFKLLYESSHSPAPQLDFPSTVSWPSNEPTPSDSTWQESSPPKLDDFDIGPAFELPWDLESSRSQASTVVEYGVTRESEEDQDPR